MWIYELINGKREKVDCSDKNCAKRECFSPHKYVHRNMTVDREVNTWEDNFYSCSYRNYRGCPDKYKWGGKQSE